MDEKVIASNNEATNNTESAGKKFSPRFDKRKGKSDNRGEKPKKEFEEALLEVRRVTRVTTGGRRMSFRAVVVIGNRNGKIAIGLAKGPDVAVAVKKATQEAYKAIMIVPVTEAESVPYPVSLKYKSAMIKLMPAAPGTGLKAGSSLRTVLNLAGYVNILTKIVGTNNKLNNALACVMALSQYKLTKKKLKGAKSDAASKEIADNVVKKVELAKKTESADKAPTVKKTSKKSD